MEENLYQKTLNQAWMVPHELFAQDRWDGQAFEEHIVSDRHRVLSF